jgi:hypothetical protein
MARRFTQQEVAKLIDAAVAPLHAKIIRLRLGAASSSTDGPQCLYLAGE